MAKTTLLQPCDSGEPVESTADLLRFQCSGRALPRYKGGMPALSIGGGSYTPSMIRIVPWSSTSSTCGGPTDIVSISPSRRCSTGCPVVQLPRAKSEAVCVRGALLSIKHAVCLSDSRHIVSRAAAELDLLLSQSLPSSCCSGIRVRSTAARGSAIPPSSGDFVSAALHGTSALLAPD